MKLDRRLKYIEGKEYIPKETVTIKEVKKNSVIVCDTNNPKEGEWEIRKEIFREIYEIKRN